MNTVPLQAVAAQFIRRHQTRESQIRGLKRRELSACVVALLAHALALASSVAVQYSLCEYPVSPVSLAIHGAVSAALARQMSGPCGASCSRRARSPTSCGSHPMASRRPLCMICLMVCMIRYFGIFFRLRFRYLSNFSNLASEPSQYSKLGASSPRQRTWLGDEIG